MKLITLTSLCLSLSKVDVILGQINSANFNQYQITQLILWVTYEKDPSFLTTNFSAVNLLLNFDKHGCWCKSTNPNSHSQQGPAIDSFDKLCRDWKTCKNCSQKEICAQVPNYQDYSEEIEEFTVQHDTDSGEITCVLPDTPTEIDTCYYHKCLCALNLATNIYDEMVAKQDTTYSWNETCEVSAPSNLVKDRCCYIDQIWYPYSSVMSNCPVESSTTTAPPEPETLVLSNQEVKDLCANTKFDFTIINDGSNSISNSNWQKTINFLNQLVSQFLSVGVQHRVTVMQFSSYNKFYTTMDHSTQGVTQALNAMRRDQIKQHTMTNYALEAAYNAIRNNRRRTTPQVALVLTDGKSTNGLGMSHITNGNTASQLRNYGVKVFTIGVTDSVDLAELQDIASDPDETYLEQLEDFDALSSFKLNLAQEMCTNYNRNLDVLDIIDFLGDKNLDAEENLEDDEGIDSHTDLIGVEYIVDNLSLEDRLYLDTLLLEQPE